MSDSDCDDNLTSSDEEEDEDMDHNDDEEYALDYEGTGEEYGEENDEDDEDEIAANDGDVQVLSETLMRDFEYYKEERGFNAVIKNCVNDLKRRNGEIKKTAPGQANKFLEAFSKFSEDVIPRLKKAFPAGFVDDNYSDANEAAYALTQEECYHFTLKNLRGVMFQVADMCKAANICFIPESEGLTSGLYALLSDAMYKNISAHQNPAVFCAILNRCVTVARSIDGNYDSKKPSNFEKPDYTIQNTNPAECEFFEELYGFKVSDTEMGNLDNEAGAYGLMMIGMFAALPGIPPNTTKETLMESSLLKFLDAIRVVCSKEGNIWKVGLRAAVCMLMANSDFDAWKVTQNSCEIWKEANRVLQNLFGYQCELQASHMALCSLRHLSVVYLCELIFGFFKKKIDVFAKYIPQKNLDSTLSLIGEVWPLGETLQDRLQSNLFAKTLVYEARGTNKTKQYAPKYKIRDMSLFTKKNIRSEIALGQEKVLRACQREYDVLHKRICNVERMLHQLLKADESVSNATNRYSFNDIFRVLGPKCKLLPHPFDDQKPIILLEEATESEAQEMAMKEKAPLSSVLEQWILLHGMDPRSYPQQTSKPSSLALQDPNTTPSPSSQLQDLRDTTGRVENCIVCCKRVDDSATGEQSRKKCPGCQNVFHEGCGAFCGEAKEPLLDTTCMHCYRLYGCPISSPSHLVALKRSKGSKGPPRATKSDSSHRSFASDDTTSQGCGLPSSGHANNKTRNAFVTPDGTTKTNDANIPKAMDANSSNVSEHLYVYDLSDLSMLPPPPPGSQVTTLSSLPSSQHSNKKQTANLMEKATVPTEQLSSQKEAPGTATSTEEKRNGESSISTTEKNGSTRTSEEAPSHDLMNPAPESKRQNKRSAENFSNPHLAKIAKNNKKQKETSKAAATKNRKAGKKSKSQSTSTPRKKARKHKYPEAPRHILFLTDPNTES